MDMQSAMIRRLPIADGVLSNAAKAIAYARKNNIPIVYVVVGFRQGAPEISMNNKGFSAYKERMANADMAEWMKIDEAVAPQAGEVVVTKRRISAFTGSDLEVVLRAYNVNHLILAGFSTSGVVLSTTLEAIDKDYGVTVLSDCCGDTDDEVHQLMVTKIFPHRGEVLTAEGWAKD